MSKDIRECPHGCGKAARWRWHDGLYVEARCAICIQSFLDRTLDDYEATKKKHRGKESWVSGYAYAVNDGERVTEKIKTYGGFKEEWNA